MRRGALFAVVAVLLVASSFILPHPVEGPAPADTYHCDQPYPAGEGNIFTNYTGVEQWTLLCYQYLDQVQAWNESYYATLRTYFFDRNAIVEVAQGFGFFSLLLLVSDLVARIPAAPAIRAAVPRRRARLPLVVGACAGTAFFIFAAAADIIFANGLLDIRVWTWPFISGLLPVGGPLALLGSGLCVWKMRGLALGTLLVVGSVAAFTTGLLLFDFREMVIYITTFSKNWEVFGVPLVSNFFAFTASWLLTLEVAWWRR